MLAISEFGNQRTKMETLNWGLKDLLKTNCYQRVQYQSRGYPLFIFAFSRTPALFLSYFPWKKKKHFKLFNCPLRRRHLVQTRSLNSSWTDYYFVRNFAPPQPKKKKKKTFLAHKRQLKNISGKGNHEKKKSNKCFLLSRSYFVTIKKILHDYFPPKIIYARPKGEKKKKILTRSFALQQLHPTSNSILSSEKHQNLL